MCNNGECYIAINSSMSLTPLVWGSGGFLKPVLHILATSLALSKKFLCTLISTVGRTAVASVTAFFEGSFMCISW